MTKCKAERGTLGEPVGDVSNTETSREEGLARGLSNTEPDYDKARESGETC